MAGNWFDGNWPTVSGQVTGRGGRPVAGVPVTVTDLSGRQIDRTNTNQDGGFRIAVSDPGTYLLVCSSNRHRPRAALVTVGPDGARHDVHLAGTLLLRGVVRDAGTAHGVVGAVLTATDSNGEVMAAVVSDSTGGYSIDDLPEGSFTLAATAAGYQPLARTVVLASGGDFDGGEVELDITLAGSARLRGVVRSAGTGTGVPAAVVTLSNNRTGQLGRVVSEQDGRYAFDGVPVGDYVLTATGYLPAALTVRAQHGDHLTVDVPLPPAGGRRG